MKKATATRGVRLSVDLRDEMGVSTDYFPKMHVRRILSELSAGSYGASWPGEGIPGIQIREEVGYGKCPRRACSYAEKLSTIRGVRERKLGAAKKLLEEALQFGFGCLASGDVIRREKAVVEEDFDFLSASAKFSTETRVCLQALGGGECGTRGLRETILIAAFERCFAVVTNAEAVIGVINAIVAVKADQDNTGPVGDVLVIGDVEEQLVENFISNPAVKNGNQWIEAHFRRIREEQFYVYVLEIHSAAFLWFRPEPRRRVCCSNCALRQ